MLSVSLTALEAAGVEEVDHLEEVTVGDVRQEEGDGVLPTPALAAGGGPQHGLEVSGVREDTPVDWQRDALPAVEDHVGPPLRSHVLANVGDHQSHVMVLLDNSVCRASNISSHHHLLLLNINRSYV